MMYVIIATDDLNKANHKELRAKHRPDHLKRLDELQKQDRLVIAGPVLRDDRIDVENSEAQGSIIIAKFGSLKEAEQWASEDPFAVNEVYFQITVIPFNQVYPK